MRNKIRDYDTMYDESTGNSGNHIAADEMIRRRNNLQDNRTGYQEGGSLRDAYEESFASASGVRGQTAETGGRIRHPETGDQLRPDPMPSQLEQENAGLADS